jgi:NAD(P)H-hydrate epimerase
MAEKRMIDKALVETLLHRRDPFAHKGTYGIVLVIAGSVGMAGAAVLCARGALRSGAGLVRVSIIQELFPVLQTAVPEAVCRPRSINKKELCGYSSVVAGPGMGINFDEGPIRTVLECNEGTVVLDADYLNRMATDKLMHDWVKEAKASVILTPHPGEAARLLHCSTEDINRDRENAARALAEQTGAIIVLKGAGTIVTAPSEEIYINTTGNPGMATGGSGDVLAGIIGGLAAQGLTGMNAALAGVFVHGLAGDLGAAALGEYGLIASDIAAMTGRAIMEIAGNQIRQQEVRNEKE